MFTIKRVLRAMSAREAISRVGVGVSVGVSINARV